jgi:anti-anti-sigma factor
MPFARLHRKLTIEEGTATDIISLKLRQIGEVVTNPTAAPFHCDVENSVEDGVKVTTVRCHGRLVNDTAFQLKELVKPLIPQGGSIVIDLGDVTLLDSLGLGTLVGLKVSAINEGYCTLKLLNLSPRVQELLRLTSLTQLFSS